MAHVFVKWQEEKWDVYAIRALDADVGMQLLAKESAIEELRGIMVMVEWEASQPPASAILLGFGTERAMERQRTRLAPEAEVGAVPNTSETETESGTQPPTKRQKGTHAPSFLECRDNRLDTPFLHGGEEGVQPLSDDAHNAVGLPAHS
ncbi:uncharacterized protein LOC144102603 [Amblyomma americanum]